ncbi:MAG: calcium/sodium antiporter [Anaerolineales bacterium]|nr:calcium/sodium antiporter [Anaerolineales bacterium]
MSLLTLTLFVAGFVLLVYGAELLVRGASKLALASGISPLVVGLTVVAYGTSAPELAVSVQSSFAGAADIAVGNVVGSNIANVLLILGISALIAPLTVSLQLVRLEVPLMIGLSALVLLLGWDGRIGRTDGLFFFAGGVAYTVITVWQSRRETAARKKEQPVDPTVDNKPIGAPQIFFQLGLIAGGLVLLVIGANWLIDGAVTVATHFGISELIIGLTIVAVGTSLPEMATSVVASLRGERDIAVGNIVGSNIFNILVVLGLSGAVAPAGIGVSSVALNFDIPVMIAVAFACLPVFFTGSIIARWEGALFLGYYLAYVSYLILNATQQPILPAFSWVMMAFVMPLTTITLVVSVIWAWRQRIDIHVPTSKI